MEFPEFFKSIRRLMGCVGTKAPSRSACSTPELDERDAIGDAGDELAVRRDSLGDRVELVDEVPDDRAGGSGWSEARAIKHRPRLRSRPGARAAPAES
jgi:hypothetical protein